jgi:hypothetical protein
MIALLLASALALGQTAPAGVANQDRPKTPYETLFPNPTGKNGFEDYVLAAMAARDAMKNIYDRQWASEYERTREIASRGERAFALMREGNKKPVSDPRTKLDMDTLFPELAIFKELCKLAQADMYVRFANGDTAGATTTFIETATFVERSVPLPSLIACLVFIAQDAILLASFEQFAHRLALSDINRLEAYARGRIQHTLPFDKAMDTELTLMEEFLKTPPDDLSVFGDDDDDEAFAAYGKLSPEERRALMEKALAINRRNVERLVATYRGPESTWKLFEPEKTGNAMLDSLVSAITIGDMAGQLFSAVAKQRTQWRLLLLHCLIEKYRILHAKLPQSLADLQRNDDIADPLTDDLFVYKPVSVRDFELYSKGTELTGPIAIRYRRQQTAEGVAADPPPPAGSRS